jgi:class 3 adenylate cyclase
VLPAIHVPTLVIGRSGDLDFGPDEVRAMASAIHGARLVELPGDDHFFWLGDAESILTEIERFITSIRMEEAELDRVLATVLVTDIVGSTERVAAIGDRAWRAQLDRHHQLIRALLARYRGREVDTAGDGFLATFDGPVRAVRCALAIVEAAADLGLEIRAGCHTGEVELDGSAVRGIAVHVGARVAATAGPGEVVVSSTVRDLVAGSGLTFDDRGAQTLKGLDEPVRLYAASGGASSATVA